MIWLPLLFACTADDPRPGLAPSVVAELYEGPVEVDPDDDLSGLAGLPCASDTLCADGPPLGDTCCSYGDSLVPVGWAPLIEPVDIAVDERRVYLCTGFGFRVAPREQPLIFTAVEDRCQHIALGPETTGGDRLVWFTHHGDSWRPEPALWTYRVTGEGLFRVDVLTEPGVLYAGLAASDTHLYVAAHGGGLRVYALVDERPQHVATVDGFTNAVAVEQVGDQLWVSDTNAVHRLSLADPARPERTTVVETPGRPRQLDALDDHVYVALGSDGIAVIDATDPSTAQVIDHLQPAGSVQAVAATSRWLAVSNWSFVSVVDRASLIPVGAEHLQPRFEQVLSVAAWEDSVYAAEWYGVSSLQIRPGWVGADLYIPTDGVQVSTEPSTTRLDLVNRGPLDLVVYDTASSDPALQLIDVP
ncbi:MAG: hypothetical protein ACI9K2_007256, partial [Myxococcota bacterium]